jgi:hypothetical protein
LEENEKSDKKHPNKNPRHEKKVSISLKNVNTP